MIRVAINLPRTAQSGSRGCPDLLASAAAGLFGLLLVTLLTAMPAAAGEEPAGEADAPTNDVKPAEAAEGSDQPPPLDLGRPEPLDPREPRTAAVADEIEARALFATGRLFEQREQYAKALQMYQRSLRYDPESLVTLRQIVGLAFQTQQSEMGVRYALKLVELDPTDQLLPRLGTFLIERGDIEGALQLFESSLASGAIAEDTAAYIALRAQLGDLYFATEQYKKAAKNFGIVQDALRNPKKYNLNDATRKLLEDQPARTYQRFGVAYLEAGDPERARAAFRKADDLESNAPLLAFREAQVLLLEDKPAAALVSLQDYFKKPSADDGQEPYELLSKLLGKLDRQKELVGQLEQLWQKFPENPEVGYALASEYLDQKRWGEAATLYQELIEESPRTAAYEGLLAVFRQTDDLPALVRLLGEAAADTQQPQLDGLLEQLGPAGKAAAESPEFAKKLLDAGDAMLANPGEDVDLGTRIALGRLAAAIDEAERADAYLSAAFEQAEGDEKLTVLQEWVSIVVTAERYAKGAELLQQALDEKLVPPGNPAVHYQLSGLLEMADQTEKALDAIGEALKIRPDLPLLHRRVAWILYHAERYDEAAKAYQEIIDDYPGTEDAKESRLILSAIYVILDNMSKAEALLEEVLDEYPGDPAASNDLGYLWADQGKNLNLALQMTRTAVEAQPDNKAYRDSLGWALYKLGRYEEALVELQKAAEGGDADGVILDHLADAYFKLGQTKQALKLWKEALEKFREADRQEPDKIEALQRKIAAEEAADSSQQQQPQGADTP